MSVVPIDIAESFREPVLPSPSVTAESKHSFQKTVLLSPSVTAES